MLLAALSSCGLIRINGPRGGNGSEAVTEPVGTETENSDPEYEKVINDIAIRAKKYLSTIEDANWNGGVVKIVSAYAPLTDAQDSPQTLSSYIADRNRVAEQKLGVKLFTEQKDEATLFAELSADAKSGNFFSDLLMIPQDSVAALGASGLLFNLRSLPKLDLSAPYFNASSVEAGSAGYYSFAVAGEMTYSLDSFYAMFFSKDALSALGIDEPYQLVKSGKWTWDEYFTLAAEAGSFAPIATGDHGDEAADAAYIAMGGKFINAGVKNTPTAAFGYEDFKNACETLRRAFTAKGALVGEAGGAKAISKAMFTVERLGAMASLADSETSWGVIPMPKQNEAQEGYITCASGDSITVAAPSVLFSDERTSQLIRVIAAASAGRVPQAFITYAQNAMLRDNDSALMLDIMVGDVRYDFAYTAGTMYPTVASATYFALRNGVFYGEDAVAAAQSWRDQCERDLAAAFPMH